MIAYLTKMLQSAAKGKAPVVAIPIEGKAPACLNRKRLAAAIKGVQVERITQLENRWLKIEGRVQSSDGVYRVRTSSTFPPIDRRTAIGEIHVWAQKEREKNLKVISHGAIGAAAMKAARKAENAKLKAAKLAEIELGGCQELEDAKRAVNRIIAEAREQGRGTTRGVSKWEAERVAEQMHVAHHAVPHRTRKTAAVIVWRLKALRTAWYEVTKYNPGRRKTTKNKFLKVKKSIQVIQIVKDATALRAKLESISPARIPNPRYAHYAEDMHWTSIDPLGRPKQDRREYYQHTYDRAALAERLREARQTIKILTPPPDNVLEMPEAENDELAKAA